MDKDNAPSEAKAEGVARNAYDANPERFKMPEQVQIRHILIAAADTDAQAKAEKILADLNPGLAMKIEEQALEEIQENKSHQRKEQYRALIADDSTSIRRMIGTMLEKAGFTSVETYFRWFNFASLVALKAA